MLLESSIFCSQQVTNRQHSGKPPLREVTESLGQSSATLRGAAREQYAAMEAGGGAVAPTLRPVAAQMTATKKISDALFPRAAAEQQQTAAVTARPVAARWKHKYKQTKGEESTPRPNSQGLGPFLSSSSENTQQQQQRAPGETR